MTTANAIAPPRRPHGKLLPNNDVVAADLIALVAGVNLASVNKVVLAINVVSQSLGEEVEELIDTESLPTERANQERIDLTIRAAERVVLQPEAAAVEATLHFIDRMSRH